MSSSRYLLTLLAALALAAGGYGLYRLGLGRGIEVGRGAPGPAATAGNPREPLKAGDHIMVDTRTQYAFEKMPKSAVEEVMLEEIPDITYEKIGGLDEQIETLHAIRARLTTCIGCGCLSLKTCSLLNPADEAGGLGGGAHYLRRVSPRGRGLAQGAE